MESTDTSTLAAMFIIPLTFLRAPLFLPDLQTLRVIDSISMDTDFISSVTDSISWDTDFNSSTYGFSYTGIHSSYRHNDLTLKVITDSSTDSILEYTNSKLPAFVYIVIVNSFKLLVIDILRVNSILQAIVFKTHLHTITHIIREKLLKKVSFIFRY